MDAKHWNIKYQEFSSSEELSENDRELLLLARNACKHAYAPYSKFQVGAAIRTKSGRSFQGSNFENASYPLCLCAERVALAAAHSELPGEFIQAIAITAINPKKPTNTPVPPCGACRQVLREVEDKQNGSIRIVLQGETGPIRILQSAATLLPAFFSGSFLKS